MFKQTFNRVPHMTHTKSDRANQYKCPHTQVPRLSSTDIPMFLPLWVFMVCSWLKLIFTYKTAHGDSRGQLLIYHLPRTTVHISTS